MNWWLYFFPVIGAFAGFFINLMVMRVLLNPANFRRNHKSIAHKLGMLFTEFISMNEIEDRIVNTENINKLMPMIEGHVDEFLNVKLSKEIPYLGMFVGEKTIASLKKIFMQEMEILFPQVMKDYVNNLKTQFDPEKMITEKLLELSPGKIENLLRSVIATRFLFLGAASGFIIGLLQVLFIYVMGNHVN